MASLYSAIAASNWPLAHKRGTQAVMRQGEVRFEPDGLLELGDGSVELALGVKRGTQVVVRLGEVRVEPDGLLELGDGGVELALGVKREPRPWCAPASSEQPPAPKAENTSITERITRIDSLTPA